MRAGLLLSLMWSAGVFLGTCACFAASELEEDVTVLAQHPALPFAGAMLPVATPAPRLSEPRPSLAAPQPDFELGPGDVVKVTVWGYPELSEQAVVLPDGTVSYPLLGPLHAAGLTAQQFAHTLRRQLDSHIESPQVSVLVSEMRSRTFSVMGDVGKPGVYPLWNDEFTVLEGVAQAGGLTKAALPAETKIFRTRSHGTTEAIPVNLTALLSEPLAGRLPMLEPGDVLYVPSQVTGRQQLCVLGEVSRPGLYPVTPGMIVTEALGAAGWVKPGAILASVMVVRRTPDGQRKFFEIDASRTVRKQTGLDPGEARDLLLEPGDIVYVPRQFFAKVGDFISFFGSKVEPAASAYEVLQ